MRNIYLISKMVVMAVILCFFIMIGEDSYARTMERESNNTRGTAQTVAFGEEYSGSVTDINYDVDDEDYYMIQVNEGEFYQISVYNMSDLTDDGWKTMIVSLCKDSDTEDDRTVSNGDYNNTVKLFRASYTGNYYLKFWNTRNTGYSFTISKYDPKGKVVKDSDSNSYRITGNYTLEFAKIASKNVKNFYFTSEEYFSNIDGIELLYAYDTPFTVTSIGKNAFKGSRIVSISLPKEIKKIGDGAFQDCKMLGSESYIMGLVIYGKNVTIGDKAFSGCKKLGTIRLIKSASIKSVKNNAFKGTKKGIRLEVPNIKKYKKLFKKAGFKKPKYTKSYI